MTATTADVKRHPVRGAIWGLFFGLGLSLILIDRAVIAFGTPKVYIVIALGVPLGALWGSFAPAKAAQQPEMQVKAEVKTSGSETVARSEEPEATGEDSSEDESAVDDANEPNEGNSDNP